jgi:putative flavoprotein involved in K+ transport
MWQKLCLNKIGVHSYIMNMNETILIIGAGPAGLAAAYELKRCGLQAHIIDQAPEVAASWRKRHDQLRLNTHRWFSGQPGMPIPRRYGAFPRRDDYVAYLNEYAAQLGLPIHFGLRANRIDRANGGNWVVHTDQSDIHSQHVIVATGSDRVPYLPEWPGLKEYHGELIHASQFRHASQYVDKSVLIVGAGNSGIDIANHLSQVPMKPSWISVRSGPTIAPQYIWGLPTHPLLVWSRWLPIKVQDLNTALVSRLFLGDLQKCGMPVPSKGAITRQKEDGVTISVDNGFVKALKAGRFRVVPEISAFSSQGVHLSDGRTLEPDTVICATGYRLGLEDLVGHLGILDQRGFPRWIADQASPDYPGLWFFGLNASIYGNMFIRKAEARRLAQAICSYQPS